MRLQHNVTTKDYKEGNMKRPHFHCHKNASGFTLVELLVALAIFGILMTMVFSSFIPVIQTNSQQSRISETKLETGIGLDLLRSDLEHAGFGLPWNFEGGAPNPYNEPTAASAPVAMNDAPNPPRALSSEDATPFAGGMNNGSDYLAIKALNATRGTTSQKWGWLSRDAAHNANMESLGTEPFVAGDRVIVIQPRENRQLVVNGTTNGNFYASYTSAALDNFAPAESPLDPAGERYLIYGLDDTAALKQRPFNRTDYYINNANIPAHCAPGTGVLTKVSLNQSDNLFTFMPIVDCVADFQVVYYLDTNTPIDGGWDDPPVNANGLNGMDAENVRQRVKSVRCYILTHQGGVDRNYIHPNQNINVGEFAADGVTLIGRAFDVSTLPNIGATWANYRWQVYSLAVTPRNLQ